MTAKLLQNLRVPTCNLFPGVSGRFTASRKSRDCGRDQIEDGARKDPTVRRLGFDLSRPHGSTRGAGRPLHQGDRARQRHANTADDDAADPGRPHRVAHQVEVQRLAVRRAAAGPASGRRLRAQCRVGDVPGGVGDVPAVADAWLCAWSRSSRPARQRVASNRIPRGTRAAARERLGVGVRSCPSPIPGSSGNVLHNVA